MRPLSDRLRATLPTPAAVLTVLLTALGGLSVGVNAARLAPDPELSDWL